MKEEIPRWKYRFYREPNLDLTWLEQNTSSLIDKLGDPTFDRKSSFTPQCRGQDKHRTYADPGLWATWTRRLVWTSFSKFTTISAASFQSSFQITWRQQSRHPTETFPLNGRHIRTHSDQWMYRKSINPVMTADQPPPNLLPYTHPPVSSLHQHQWFYRMQRQTLLRLSLHQRHYLDHHEHCEHSA